MNLSKIIDKAGNELREPVIEVKLGRYEYVSPAEKIAISTTGVTLMSLLGISFLIHLGTGHFLQSSMQYFWGLIH